MEPLNPNPPREDDLPAGPAPQETPAPKKRRRVLAVVGELIKVIALLLLGAAIAVLVVPPNWRLRARTMSSTEKLDLLDQMVRDYYIDGDAVDRDAMQDDLAAAYIYGLGDPYSAYFSAEDYSAVLADNRGDMTGIGVSVTFDPATTAIYVIRVYQSSPAEEAGLRPGDRVTAVAGETVTEDNYSACVDNVRGAPGTSVALTVLRDGKTFEMSVIREDFVVTTVFARRVGDVGVIEITGFNQPTASQFRKAVEELQDAGVKALIFDLRGNTGGLVDTTSEMLDLLLPEGELGYAVYNGGKRESMATSDAAEVDLPMAVLVDRSTASAAEYFTLALRDYDKAVVVGETTFGKGIMQSTMPLGDGSAVRLTVAKFYTKSGTEFHGVGITPDVEAALPEGANRFLLSDEEDAVLQAALNAIKKQ